MNEKLVDWERQIDDRMVVFNKSILTSSVKSKFWYNKNIYLRSFATINKLYDFYIIIYYFTLFFKIELEP